MLYWFYLECFKPQFFFEEANHQNKHNIRILIGLYALLEINNLKVTDNHI